MQAAALSNQGTMDRALGKPVMNGGFRHAFLCDTERTSDEAAIPLTDGERNARHAST